MKSNRLDNKLSKLLIAFNDADYFLSLAKWKSEKVNHDYLADARSELSNASNAIDEAMGLIDDLLAPEPMREDLE